MEFLFPASAVYNILWITLMDKVWKDSEADIDVMRTPIRVHQEKLIYIVADIEIKRKQCAEPVDRWRAIKCWRKVERRFIASAMVTFEPLTLVLVTVIDNIANCYLTTKNKLTC